MTSEQDSNQLTPRTSSVERRKHPRFKVNLPVEHRRLYFDALDDFTGRALNISEGGLEIHLSENVEVGQRLNLKLSFSPDPEADTIEAQAEIVWLEFTPGGEWGDYRCGVRFLELSPDALKKLEDFILRISK